MIRKQRDETQVTNMAGIRRNLKNLAHNYSDAQVKVREATSNDAWGPSSTLMSEIADLTYNVNAFTEIMQMIWKRLNDHGKNWRHVYKALILLDYLIKTGSEKVAMQCRENIFAILTLRDFQHMDDGKDQGLNVREKAKQLVTLLKDEEKLRAERGRALKAKERFAQVHTSSGFGSDSNLDSMSPSSPSFSSSRNAWSSEPDRIVNSGAIDMARPQTAGEEELQLQLALAMSREEAEQEEQKRRSDDVRLQLALSQSENEFKQQQQQKDHKKKTSHIEDLLDVNLGTPAPAIPQSLGSLASPPTTDPWGMPISRPQSDPWSTAGSAASTSTPADPWSPLPAKSNIKKDVSAGAWGDMPAGMTSTATSASAAPADPWSPLSPASPTSPPTHSAAILDPMDDFISITNRNNNNSMNNNNSATSGGSPNPFEMSGLSESLSMGVTNGTTAVPRRKSPHSFLGENSALVNLDQLVTKPPQAPPHSLTAQPTPIAAAIANPFSPVGGRPPVFGSSTGAMGAPSLPQPLIPGPTANPFLS